jgi:hypothetical protein
VVEDIRNHKTKEKKTSEPANVKKVKVRNARMEQNAPTRLVELIASKSRRNTRSNLNKTRRKKIF